MTKHFYQLKVNETKFHFSNIGDLFSKLMEYYVPTPEGKLPKNDLMRVCKEGGILFDTKKDLESILKEYGDITINIDSKSRTIFRIRTVQFD